MTLRAPRNILNVTPGNSMYEIYTPSETPSVGLKANSSILAPNTALGNQQNNLGGFFGNGNDLGFNLDTAKFGLGGLGNILQLFSANAARKAMEEQTALARENMQMSKTAYNDRTAYRARGVAAQLPGSTKDSIASAESDALKRYGTDGILSRTQNLG